MIDGIELRPILRPFESIPTICVDQIYILCAADEQMVFRLDEMPWQSAQYVPIDIPLASLFTLISIDQMPLTVEELIR